MEKVFAPPPSPVKTTLKGTAKAALPQAMVADRFPGTPQPRRLGMCLHWRQRHANQFVIDLITKGVEPQFHGHHLILCRQKESEADIRLATSIMEEYVSLGAAREVPLEGTEYLVPWFVISKTEGVRTKRRLISDCRQINQSLSHPRFKLDHWKDIFPVLEPKMWAVKIDLQNANFHLPLAHAIKSTSEWKSVKKCSRWKGLVLA